MGKSRKLQGLTLRIQGDVARTIRRHARSEVKTEVCGVLIGSETDGVTTVEACISGENAAQGGAHVTFTQDTWEHIYKIKDRDYPQARIIGWYHSHPGFGVFLSEHDTFIHKNFFSSPQQVAWVFDPHSDEEGVFGWHGEQLERLPHFDVIDDKGGTPATLSGSSEPSMASGGESSEWDDAVPVTRKTQGCGKDTTDDEEVTRLARIVSSVFSHLAVFLLGCLLVWYLLPRILVVPVDPNAGQPLHSLQEGPSSKPSGLETPPAQQANPNPKTPESGDGHR